jgi:dienelactone hydrolase
MMRSALSLLLLLVASLVATTQPTFAAVKSESVEYTASDGTVCEGYFAWDDAVTGQRPAVLVVHQYRGPGEYEHRRAAMLAELGYLAFVCDVYGKAVRPASHEAGLAEVGKYYGDRVLFRERLFSGYDRVWDHPLFDGERIAAIGYCFGGTGVLELARDSTVLQGVVSFHGNLDTTMPARAEEVLASILVLHGAADPFVPKEQVAAFEHEMHAARADWYLIEYAGALHAFTMWGMNMPGQAKYDEAADKRSWRAMQDFFGELWGK